MDIKEALDVANVEVKNGSSEDEIFICCPFCLEEGEPSLDERFRLGINTRTGAFQCFNCSKKGYGDWILHELQRVLETGDLELAEKHRKDHKKTKRRVMLPEGFELLQHPNGDRDHWANKAWRYVRKRGVTERQIKEKQIGYTLIGDYHHRIVAPVYRHNKLLGFVGRDMTDQMELKYLNSVGDKAIYNLPDKAHKSICLSEGFFDALAIERGSLKLGIDSGAVLGHDLKDEQLELLLSIGYKYFYLWLDPDIAGIKGTIKIAKKIPSDKIVYVVISNEFADPSDLERSVVCSRLRHVKRATPELLDKLRGDLVLEE